MRFSANGSNTVSYTHLDVYKRQIHTKTLYFRDNLSSSDQAAVYLNGSQPFVQITTDSHTKQRLLIFADDNVGPLVQFLLPHYDLITVVNLSYSPEYYQPLINPVDYTDNLFFFSVQSLSNRDQFTNLEHI